MGQIPTLEPNRTDLGKHCRNLIQASLPPGAIVYLKRGSIWTERLHLFASGQLACPSQSLPMDPGRLQYYPIQGTQTIDYSVLYLHGSYITIDNLHFQDSGFGIEIFSDHNIIQNTEINDVGEWNTESQDNII